MGGSYYVGFHPIILINLARHQAVTSHGESGSGLSK